MFGTTSTSSGAAKKQRVLGPKFSYDSYLSSLSEREKELLELETDKKIGIGKGWLQRGLGEEIRKKYFLDLKEFLKSEQSSKQVVYPPKEDIYSWSRFTPLESIRVCIIGQDPYHGPRQAHGLCFSVRSVVDKPPSLRNIFQEINAEYGTPENKFAPNHGYLGSWAANGVLLLNTCLTVRGGQANSHSKKGWEQFTDAVLKLVDKHGGRNGKGVVFMAWGTPAQKRCAGLDKKKHLILQSAHPSPLSVHRGFSGNGHFKKANDWLENKYGVESVIDWTELKKEDGVRVPLADDDGEEEKEEEDKKEDKKKEDKKEGKKEQKKEPLA
ncbi:uracil-DNA glycosylase [Atractiella rhizophila]|nr:uracil-DNA glycosylase [Atractiella rhizophila]